MSLYAQFLTEKTHDEIIENNYGFATYRYLPDGSCYIIDIYTVPSVRRSGVAASLADKIVEFARAKGCKELIGTVNLSSKNPSLSMKVLLGYGMEIKSVGSDYIIFRKDI